MVTLTKIGFLLYVIVFLLSGCALHNTDTESGQKSEIANVVKNKITLKPNDSFEECVALKKGQIMIYKFSSSKSVDFNVHHHTASGVKYPVLENEITEYNGTLDPEKELINLEEEEFICMMWENKDMKMLHFSYECVIRDK